MRASSARIVFALLAVLWLSFQVVFVFFSILFVLPMVGVAGVSRSLRSSGVFTLAGAVATASQCSGTATRRWRGCRQQLPWRRTGSLKRARSARSPARRPGQRSRTSECRHVVAEFWLPRPSWAELPAESRGTRQKPGRNHSGTNFCRRTRAETRQKPFSAWIMPFEPGRNHSGTTPEPVCASPGSRNQAETRQKPFRNHPHRQKPFRNQSGAIVCPQKRAETRQKPGRNHSETTLGANSATGLFRLAVSSAGRRRALPGCLPLKLLEGSGCRFRSQTEQRSRCSRALLISARPACCARCWGCAFWGVSSFRLMGR